MKDKFNHIEIIEAGGEGKIFIDNVDVRGISRYVIDRGTNMVDLTINMCVPVTNFKTNLYQ